MQHARVQRFREHEMTTPPPSPPPDPIVSPSQVKAAPFYWPNLIAALIAAICVAIGSIGPWIAFMGMSRNNIGSGADGTITLILGIVAALALFVLLNFGRTQVKSGRMVGLGTVAGIAGVLAFIIGFVDARTVSSRKAEIFGNTIGPDIGWGLWMILIAGPVLAVTSAVVVKQVKNIAKANAESASPAHNFRIDLGTPASTIQPPASPAPTTLPPPSPAAPTPPPPPPMPAPSPPPAAVASTSQPSPEPPPVPFPFQEETGPSARDTLSASTFPVAAPAGSPPEAQTRRIESGTSGIRRAAPWVAGAAAVGAAFAGGIWVAPHLTGGKQNSGTESSTTATRIAAPPPSTALSSPMTTATPQEKPAGATDGVFGPFDSGNAEVFVDGKPREVRGKIKCYQYDGDFWIMIEPPGNKVTVKLSQDLSRVLTVDLGTVNGKYIPMFLDGSARGNASATNNGNSHRITGTISTGYLATDPTLPFEIDVTCP